MQSRAFGDLVRESAGAGERVYVVIDAARAGLLCQTAREQYGLSGRSLFDGPLASMLDHVAPHLFPLERDAAFVGEWGAALGRAGGVLLGATAGLEALWSHLRALLVATDETGVQYSFRFYDPRVLRVFLPTCSPVQASEFFGPASWMLVEGESPGTVLRCAPGRQGVKIEALRVANGG